MNSAFAIALVGLCYSWTTIGTYCFQTKTAFPEIKDSTSYGRNPQGNGTDVRFVRNLRENRHWIRGLGTAEVLRPALLDFK